MSLSFFISYLRNIIRKFLTGKQIEVIHHSENIMIIKKDYDLKINSNSKSERTVQTLLRKQYPLLANQKLFHEFYFPHRLDFATSGVMCIPLHKKACRLVSDNFLSRDTRKYYIALVRGLFSKEIIDLDIPIGEDVRYREIQKMCTENSEFCRKSRKARTIILVLEEGTYNDYPATKILVKPVTGRRHQIRVHCSYLGHTIVGDYTYSNRKDTLPHRMFLHSLRLVLPLSIEYVDVATSDPFLNEDKWSVLKVINGIDELSYEKLESSM